MQNFMRVFALVALLLIIPSVTFASPVIRTGNEVSLKEDQEVSGDFYGLGSSVTNSAKMTGDSHIAGWAVTQNGETVSDLTVIAATLQVHAPVGDDLRAIGGQVVIGDRVVGDVAVFAGELTILSTAEIDGDVMFYGGVLNVEGPVKGSVFGSAESVRIDANIGKDVTVTARNEMVLGSHANIAGDVSYKSQSVANRALESTVVGEITRDESHVFVVEETRPSAIPFLIMLFSGFVMRFMFGARLSAFLSKTTSVFGPALLFGFASVFLIPIAIVLSFVSVLGIGIGVALLAGYLLLASFSFMLAGVFLGGVLSRYGMGAASYGVFWITLGTAVLYALTFVPVIGTLSATVITLMVFGGCMMRLYELYR